MSTRKIILTSAALILFASSAVFALPTGFGALNYKGTIATNSGNLAGQMGANNNGDCDPFITAIPRLTTEDTRPATGENTTVPEPTTLALFGLGTLGLGIFRKKFS